MPNHVTNKLILECDHNKVMDIMSYFSIKDKGDNFFLILIK